MKLFNLFLAVFILQFSCTGKPRYTRSSSHSNTSVEKPAETRTKKGIFQTGTASWYGKQFQGKQTANGERFDMHKLTAAHRRLPFNTKVRVTNLKNGRSVTVRINDRGPFSGNRILDLSYAAAAQLKMIQSGTANVSIEIISP